MTKLLPAWLKGYRQGWLAGDLGAGIIVALMLVPQGMAYALIAGLPPVTGLYASVLPALLYAVFGSSMVQSVGPMGITSLMTGTALAALAPVDPAQKVLLAALMAGMVGVALLVCGVLRLGVLANFLSRPVLAGFTTGAAIMIGVGQFNLLLGTPKGTPLREVFSSTYLPGIALGLGSLVLLWLLGRGTAPLLRRIGIARERAEILSKLTPILVLVVATVVCVALGEVAAAIPRIGAVPAGWPTLDVARLAGAREQLPSLLVPASLIGFMVFLSSQGAAVSLAQRRGERIDANRELLGLGAANLASAVSGAFPVTGSLSRSAVNHGAGANTPLASLISAALVGALLLMPQAVLEPLSWMPMPAMGALIIMAVLGMVDLDTLRTSWKYDRADTLAYMVTALGVLGLGIDRGVILGVVVSFATLIARTSRPNVAVLGRIPGTEHFRDIGRHQAETLPGVLMLRVDAGLFFGNGASVIDRIEAELARPPAPQQLVLVMSAVNLIDTSSLYVLIELNRQLAANGRQLHLAEVKGPLMERLQRGGGLLDDLSGQVFRSANDAFEALRAAQGEPRLATRAEVESSGAAAPAPARPLA